MAIADYKSQLKKSLTKLPILPRKFLIPLAVFAVALIVVGVSAKTGFLNYVITGGGSPAPPADPTPGGQIYVNAAPAFNSGIVTFKAVNVHGANGAAVQSVRYYLLNPTLSPANNWGDPDWCSSGTPCTQTTKGGYITYDISESSNSGNSYQVIWDQNTHSSGSTPYSRALTPLNIPQGTYKVGLRVEDVNGNVKGDASFLTLTILDGTVPGGEIRVNPISASVNGGSFTFTALGVHGANGAAVDNVRYFIINPRLVSGHNWGKPDWCSSPSCSTADTKTYDISESSNGDVTNRYKIVWDQNTHSSGSTPYSRALTASNILPGTYKIGLRVEDVDGNVAGGASEITIAILNPPAPTPIPTPTPTPTPKTKSPPCYFTDLTGHQRGYGDVDADGDVDNADATLMAKHIAGKVTLTGDNFKAADLNGDTLINSNDYGQISSFVAGTKTTFTVCPKPTPIPTPISTPTLKSSPCFFTDSAGHQRGYGDIDADGDVDNADSLLMARHFAGSITLTGDDFKAADLNADGRINSGDYGQISSYLAGKISTFLVCANSGVKGVSTVESQNFPSMVLKIFSNFFGRIF